MTLLIIQFILGLAALFCYVMGTRKDQPLADIMFGILIAMMVVVPFLDVFRKP